jgi:hypothetical protein
MQVPPKSRSLRSSRPLAAAGMCYVQGRGGVKTSGRVRTNAIPDAQTAIAAVSHWMNDYNRASEHPSVYVIEEKIFAERDAIPWGVWGSDAPVW